MQALLSEPEAHADPRVLNPSNVLVHAGQPYFIDWQTAMYGPFYVDLPHHHCTLEQAEHYRLALAARGRSIARSDFAERYRVAARYIWLALYVVDARVLARGPQPDGLGTALPRTGWRAGNKSPHA